ncbi:MAG: DUF6922 domain-containing protein [Candidatus Ratteibacteria bacterium]
MDKNLEILKELFWDYEWSSVLEKIDSPFVIARVLEIGDEEQVKAFENSTGKEKIKDFLKKYGKRLLSKMSYNFWSYCYGIKKRA